MWVSRGMVTLWNGRGRARRRRSAGRLTALRCCCASYDDYILASVTLYLDIVNLFFFILQLLSSNRD